MKKKKTKPLNSYPIYFRQSECTFYCLFNEQIAMSVDIYGFTTKIQCDMYGENTWIHDIWKDKREKCTELSKTEFKKAFKTAMKILQEKL